jgi:hypothetical protein
MGEKPVMRIEPDLRQVAKLTWQLDPELATPAELGPYLDRVHSLGGGYLIHGKSCLSVERACQAKEQFARDTERIVKNRVKGFEAECYAQSVGWSLSSYMAELGFPRNQSLFEVLPLNERLLEDESLRRSLLRGFQNAVMSRYDEQEELFPGSKCSTRLQKERESFCRSFEEYVAQRVDHLTHSREKVLHRIVRESNKLRAINPGRAHLVAMIQEMTCDWCGVDLHRINDYRIIDRQFMCQRCERQFFPEQSNGYER